MHIPVDSKFLVKTLVDLVRINSVNPSLVSGAPGEAEAAGYISNSLRKFGLDARICDIGKGRVNVVSALKGCGGGKSLLLNAHMDTVGIEGMPDPFSGKIDDSKVFGRGALDMKGSIAAMLAAVKTIVDDGIRLKGDLIFSAVSDEEYGSNGTEALVKEIKADAALVTEPTGLDVCLVHKGFSVIEITTSGRAAHGGSYKDGIDANMHMGRILNELDKLARELTQREGHPLVGPPSIHVPLVKGGTQQFIYSDRCVISVERRMLPGELHTEIVDELNNILNKLRDDDKNFSAGLRTVMSRSAYEISPEAEIVKVTTGAAARILGRQPKFIGHDWWEDSALISDAGIPAVIIGPAGGGLHSHEEWVDIQSVIDLTKIIVHTAIDFCGICN